MILWSDPSTWFLMYSLYRSTKDVVWTEGRAKQVVILKCNDAWSHPPEAERIHMYHDRQGPVFGKQVRFLLTSQ
jgi:hypothetical protein